MKISLNWLKEYVSFKKEVHQLGLELNNRTMELEKISKIKNDVILEFDVGPNRPDLLSVLGFAREVSAIENIELKYPERIFLKKAKDNFNNLLKVTVKNDQLCPRYAGIIIEGIEITPSPQWLKEKLERVDIKSINNIVDITNYVMLEFGQPLHAFDYEKIQGKEIIVRNAKEGESIISFDKKEYQLNKDILVIADKEKPIAIAGILGGVEAQITKKTKTIVLESANFNMRNIRNTSRNLGIRTEASTRFEKGLDPENVILALERAIFLIKKLSSCKRIIEYIDIYNEQKKERKISISLVKMSEFLGLEIEENKVLNILKRLGFKYQKKKDEIIILVPTHREDIKRSVDIYEEVSRIYGYDKLPFTLPSCEIKPPVLNKNFYFENLTKDILTSFGFSEVYNTSFIGEKEINKYNLDSDKHLELLNPLSIDLKYLRTTIIPHLFLNIEQNINKFETFKIYELGRIYLKNEKEKVIEKRRLTGVSVSNIRFNKSESEFFILKEIVLNLLNKIGIKEVKFNLLKEFEEVDYNKAFWHPKRTAILKLKDEVIGKIGEVSPIFLEQSNIFKRAGLFDLDFDLLQEKAIFEKKYLEPSKYPSLIEDLSIIVNKKIPYEKLKETILSKGKDMISKIELVDVYEGKQIKSGERSLTLRIKYQSYKSTLTNEEIKNIRKNIIESFEKTLGAKLRGKID